MSKIAEDSQKKVIEIASTHLGKIGGYSFEYDPSILVKVPRQLNRDSLNINPTSLPFEGFDIWNAYEVSALTHKGLPVNGVLKITMSADSEYHVESKSLKLYLNSLNMHPLGSTVREVKIAIEELVARDLKELLNTKVYTSLTLSDQVPYINPIYDKITPLSNLVDLDRIVFSENTELQTKGNSSTSSLISFKTDLLRSNCRVTNQPDWGDLYVSMETSVEPVLESIAQYIVGHRSTNHFHEEMAEMIFMDLLNIYKPTSLVVMCLYTRRGGIDINPIRYTSGPSSDIIMHLKQSPFWELLNAFDTHSKTLRQ